MCVKNICWGTKTITIPLDAYNGLKKGDSENFSDLIIRIIPEKRKLSEILSHYDPNDDLSMSIEKGSEESRSIIMREVSF